MTAIAKNKHKRLTKLHFPLFTLLIVHSTKPKSCYAYYPKAIISIILTPFIITISPLNGNEPHTPTEIQSICRPYNQICYFFISHLRSFSDATRIHPQPQTQFLSTYSHTLFLDPSSLHTLHCFHSFNIPYHFPHPLLAQAQELPFFAIPGIRPILLGRFRFCDDVIVLPVCLSLQ